MSLLVENTGKSELRKIGGFCKMGSKEILPEFQDFLLSNKLAPQKNVLFLAIWVSKFLAFSNRKGHQKSVLWSRSF